MQALRSSGRLRFWETTPITEVKMGPQSALLVAAMVKQYHAGSHWRERVPLVGSGSDDDDDDDDDDEVLVTMNSAIRRAARKPKNDDHHASNSQH